MLGYLFGFNARISRVPFVLCTLVLGCGLMLLAYGLTGTPPGFGRTDVLLAQAVNNGPMLIVFFAALAVSFMLQSMRVRDIGWDPICVMAGWIALVVIDRTMATKFPQWALNQLHTGTPIGGLISAALMLVLFCWPSSQSGAETPLPYDHAGGADGARRQTGTPVEATKRIARVANGEFGGRVK